MPTDNNPAPDQPHLSIHVSAQCPRQTSTVESTQSSQSRPQPNTSTPPHSVVSPRVSPSKLNDIIALGQQQSGPTLYQQNTYYLSDDNKTWIVQPSPEQVLDALNEVFHETNQVGNGASTTLNAVLQGPYFVPEQLAAEIKGEISDAAILEKALSPFDVTMDLWNLNLVGRTPVEECSAFIILQNSHWFAIRRFGNHWMNLNAFIRRPAQILMKYVDVSLTQLSEDQCIIYSVIGTLPPCPADKVKMFAVEFTWGISGGVIYSKPDMDNEFTVEDPENDNFRFGTEDYAFNEEEEEDNILQAIALSLQDNDMRPANIDVDYANPPRASSSYNHSGPSDRGLLKKSIESDMRTDEQNQTTIENSQLSSEINPALLSYHCANNSRTSPSIEQNIPAGGSGQTNAMKITPKSACDAPSNQAAHRGTSTSNASSTPRESANFDSPGSKIRRRVDKRRLDSAGKQTIYPPNSDEPGPFKPVLWEACRSINMGSGGAGPSKPQTSELPVGPVVGDFDDTRQMNDWNPDPVDQMAYQGAAGRSAREVHRGAWSSNFNMAQGSRPSNYAEYRNVTTANSKNSNIAGPPDSMGQGDVIPSSIESHDEKGFSRCMEGVSNDPNCSPSTPPKNNDPRNLAMRKDDEPDSTNHTCAEAADGQSMQNSSTRIESKDGFRASYPDQSSLKLSRQNG